MISIIHGDDTAKSREHLNKLNITFTRFDASSSDINEIRQSLKGDSLFASEQHILIENLFSKKAKSVEEIITLINASSSNVYIYDGKEVGAKNLKLFPKAQSSVFSYPKTLFSFLDGIYPGNSRIIGQFDQALQSTELEILVFMMIRQFRLMLGVLLDSEIDEVARLAPWQRSKISRQASFFGEEKLKKTYRNIFEIDLGSKSGKLSLPLKETIDIFLLNL